MIDIVTETLITLDQAAEKLLVSKQVVTKWIKFGSDGVRLEAIKLGAHWRTSQEALQRFGNRLTPNYEELPPVAPSVAAIQRERHLVEVNERLDELFNIKRCATCKKELCTFGKIIPSGEKLWCPQCLIKLPSVSIGRRIRTFRWEAKMSQIELCGRTGISVGMLRAFEKEDAVPTELDLSKLVEIFGPDLASGWNGSNSNGSVSRPSHEHR